jgi:hypothetical protein
VIQCLVKPQEAISVYGKCYIQLPPDESEDVEGPVSKPTVNTADEDNDEEEVPVQETEEEAPKKKVVKKKS